MRKSYIIAALATAGLAAAAPVTGQVRVGGHGGVGIGNSVRVGVPRVQTPRVDSRVGVETRARARVNSQGPARASVRARARANENSVLRADLLPPNLVGLRTGLVVRNSAGVRVGTVSRIVTSDDGRVRTVLVAREGRRGTIALTPRTLRVDGDLVTTTAVRLNR
jgi:hypothetical protein